MKSRALLTRLSRLLIVLAALVLPCAPAFSQQVSDSLSVGFPFYGVFTGSDFDSVQVVNRNLHIDLPLSTTDGRGMPLTFKYVYDSAKFYVTSVCPSNCAYTVRAERGSAMGLTFSNSASYQISDGQSTKAICGTQTAVVAYTNVVLRTPDQTKHHFVPDVGNNSACFAQPTTLYADDGSGWMMSVRSSDGLPLYAKAKDGTLVNVSYNPGSWSQPGVLVEDSNGNQIIQRNDTSPATIIDTLGRSQPAYPQTNPSTGRDELKYYDANGNQQVIQIVNQAVNFQTNLCPGIASGGDTCTEYKLAFSLPQQIILPNGLAYTINYVQNSYGEVSSINLPTGGTISYTYNYSYTITDGPTVASRTVTANGVSATWNYSATGFSNGTQFNIVTAPVVGSDTVGNDTRYTFNQIIPQLTQGFSAVSKPTKIEYFHGSAGSGQLLKTVQISYGAQGLPSSVTTIWNEDPNLSTSKVETDWDFLSTSLEVSWGNPTAKREYDYGTGGNPGNLLRTTVYQYEHLINSAYLNANLADLPTSKRVYDGACCASMVAETLMTYDGAALTTTANVPNHDYGVGALRGDLTHVDQWLHAPPAADVFLPTDYTYDDLGNRLSMTDPGDAHGTRHVTNYSYADDFTDSVCLPTSTSYAYLTQTTNAVGFRTHTKHFSCTGQVASIQDENDMRANRPGTVFSYDSMKRPSQRTNADTGSTSLAYGTTLPLTITTTTAIGNGVSPLVTVAEEDDLGRTRKTKLTSDPEGTVFTRVQFDQIGRKSQEWNPTRCDPDASPNSCSGEPTFGSTSYQYDALGRVVKEIPPDGTNSSNNVVTQYSGNMTTVTDQAGKQRRSYADGLGRLVRVDEPTPPGAAGTPGSGTINLSGTERSTQVITQSAAPGSASISITGAVGQKRVCDPDCRLIDDATVVYVTVKGSFTKSANGASPGYTGANAVSDLANAFNGDANSPVSATAASTTLTLTSKQAGAASNYSLAVSQSWDDVDFTNPAFTISAPSALSGGKDAVFGTDYDSGTVTVTVNGFSKSSSYGQNSTAASVASDLAGQFTNDSGSPVSASASGGALTLTSKTVGQATNYALTTSSNTNQPSLFSGTSFPIEPASGALTGGADATGGLYTPFITNYVYNALDDLTCVQQQGGVSGTGCAAPPSSDASSPWRVRRFTYDSLGRLLTAANPESGAVSYGYDPDGNMTAKTDARGITITYGYDALDRLTGKSYSNGDAAVSYLYDQTAFNGLTIVNGIGRHTGMTDASGASAWSFDAMGRVTTDQQTVNGITKSVLTSYNLEGGVTAVTYPSGHQVSYAYNSAARVTSVTDAGGNIHYAQADAASPMYAPTGTLANAEFGNTAAFAGIMVADSYNARGQPVSLQAGVGGQSVLSLGYDFGWGSADNGTLRQITNNRDSTRSESFSYDQLNRITSAKSAAPAGANCWGEAYTVDAWGNLAGRAVINCAGGGPLPAASAANQRAGDAYDAAGNLTTSGYSYDAENRVKAASGVSYTYDGEGARVAKSNGKMYWGAGPLAESDGSGNLTEEYIFFNGKRIARRDVGTGNVHYYFSDHLGSANVITNASGGIEEESDFYPFGGERMITDTGIANNFKFTGKERDSESGLDYFGARYYSSAMGRFLTPDWSATPVAVPYAILANPQTLNLYSYVENNPITGTDPDGHLMFSSPVGAGTFSGADAEPPTDPGDGDETHQYIQQAELEFAAFLGASSGYAQHIVEAGRQPKAENQAGVAAKQTYKTQDEAATAAEGAALDATDQSGRKYEYGGWILKNKHGQYTYTIAVTFRDPSHFYPDSVTIPKAFAGVADYHTHPHSTKTEGEGLSAGDEQHAYDDHRTVYEADTYSRNVYRFTPGVSEYKRNEWCCGVIGDFVAHIPQ